MKKIIWPVLSLLILGAWPSQSAETWSVYKGSEMGFEMPYSSDWKPQDNNMKTSAPWVLFRLPSKMKPEGVVSVLKLNLAGIAFGKVIEEEKKLKTTQEIKKAKVDGRDAHQVFSKEDTLKKVSYLLPDGDSFWRIYFGAHPKEFDSFQPTFDRVLAGFKFVPPAPPAPPAHPAKPEPKKGKK
jgi:hypothetical protein